MSTIPLCNRPLLIAILGSFALSACVSNEPRPTEAAPATAQETATAAPAPAAATLPECPSAPRKTANSKTKNSKKGKSPPASEPAPCREPAKAAAGKAPEAAAPAAAAPIAATAGGYDLSRNKPVTDSTKVQAGEGTRVKGNNDWEGEISGIPAAGSRFTRLRIGMPLQQAIDIAGTPTDQGAYVTGKAFIPFYFGSDKTRWEAVYKGQGRLIFASQAGFGTGQYLVWIIHNSKEPGYR